MSVLFLPRYLEPGSSWEISTTLLIGMLMMVVIHCFVAAIRIRERRYLLLGLFYVGALINSTGNVYVTFLLPTIEPYIGSWIMMASFVLFMESYLALPEEKTRMLVGKAMLVLSLFFLVVSVGHNLSVGRQDTRVTYTMDVITAVFLLTLLCFLLFHAIRGNKKARNLFFLELTIVVGGIATLGVVKNSVVATGLFPVELFQSNFIFVLGMTLNGVIFSNLLSVDVMNLKVKAAVAVHRAEQLRELDAAKNDFIMNFSHEFRTPITIIGGVAKQLKGGRWGDSISANRGNIEVIERNNLRLHKQVDGILRLASMEQRQHALHPEPINLRARLKSLIGEFSSIAQLKNITIEMSAPESLEIIADVDLFQTALVNLVGNALKFTPVGGAVFVSAFRSSHEVCVVVEDNGPGIPDEEQERVFRRFHRGAVPGSTRSEGTGIGLSLVKGIMERHHGSVELKSAVGKGSSFTLAFPVSETRDALGVDTPAEPDRDREARKSVLEPLIGAHRAEIFDGIPRHDDLPADPAKAVVLVVEDDPELRRLLAEELSCLFSVVKARDGGDALRQMKHHVPDLVISDVMMPEMDGYQLCAAMAEDTRLQTVPVLFLTARAGETERVSAYAKGAVDYITKPFSMEIVRARARNIVETNRSLRQGYQQHVKRSMTRFVETLFSDQESGNDEEYAFSDYCRSSQLTDRETEVAFLVRKGYSDKEIASRLGLSAKTVGNHNSSIFRKCGFGGRLNLVTWGRPSDQESSQRGEIP